MARAIKPGSKQDREQLRHEMSERGLSIEEIADEMARRFGFRPREAHRHASGWTLDEAVRRFNAAAAELGADQDGRAPMIGTRLSTFEKWPRNHDGRRPSVWVLNVLATVYGTSTHRLLDLDDHRALPEKDRLLIERQRQGPPPRGALPVQGETAPLERRPWFAARQDPRSGRDLAREQGLTPQVVDVSADESLRFAELAEATNVADGTIDTLRGDVVGIALEYTTTPLEPLFADLLRVRDQAYRLLGGRQPPAQARGLHVIAGRACALLANVAMDVGRHQAALAHARAAWTFARDADHWPLLAWVRGIQSSISYWSGRFADSARLAAGGAAYAASGTTGVFLASLQARAHGQLGDARAVEEAVARAERARASAGADEVGGVFGFPLAKQHLYAASAYVGLGLPAPARRHAQQALDLYETGAAAQRSYGDEAGARLDLALSNVRLRELDGAADAVRPVLALPVELRVSSISQRLGRLHDELTRTCPSVPSARELREEIVDFRHVAGRARLPEAGTTR